MGDFSTLSYTHWEGFMALHHQRRIQLYYLEGSQPQHLQRMKLALPQRHGGRFVADTDLFGQWAPPTASNTRLAFCALSCADCSASRSFILCLSIVSRTLAFDGEKKRES